jgi:hypothetical protein
VVARRAATAAKILVNSELVNSKILIEVSDPGGLAALSSAVVQFIIRHLAAERVAMDAQYLGGARLVPVGSLEHSFDKFLLKLSDCFVKQNTAFNHLHYKPFQLISHFCTLQSYVFNGPAS